ncbi:MAG: thiamine-phosphate kinase [Candidatus Zixiibacteriota bacterium]
MKYGEFELIDKISSLFSALDSSDDAAFIPSGNGYIVLTCDEMSEDIHYRRNWLDFIQIGYRAVSAAVSDLAACGASSGAILTAIAIPDNLEESHILEIYKGIARFTDEFDIELKGGNIAKSTNGIKIVTTAVGYVDYPIKRSQARTDDIICITGDIGRSGFALNKLLTDDVISSNRILEKFICPKPRLEIAKALSELNIVHSMADISDGLIADLKHILDASNKGAIIHLDKINIDKSIKDFYADKKKMHIDAANSGEEFELIMTMSEKNLQKAQKAIYGNIWPIGQIIDSGYEVFYKGEMINNDRFKGFRHF